MSDNVYPSLDEKSLRLVARIAASNPEYFNDPECPYSPETKALFQPKIEYVEQPIDGEVPTTENIQSRVLKLVQELEAFGRDAQSMSSAEKNTYFRLSVSLLKDLTEMREKLSNIGAHEDFMATVLGILDEVCDADQKSTFRDRLEKFHKGDENVAG